MATQVVTGTVTFLPAFSETISAGVISTLNLPAALNINQAYSNATTGALTIDQIHAKVYTLVASTPQTIDLTTLTDLNGNAMNLARVRDIICVNNDTTISHVVLISRGASNGWAYLPASTSALTAVALGGVIWLHDPNNALSTNGMVTSGSSKTILLDPGANTVNLSVLIVGGSAT